MTTLDHVEESYELTDADLSPIERFRTQHHTAVLVVLFTDLKGSTELAEQKGEVYAQSVRHNHDEMLREIIERNGAGRCLKNIGDALMCVFAEPTAAVDRAVEIQEKLAEYNQAHPDDVPMHVRIGMHMGQVAVEEDVNVDVFGRHVNRAARIEGLADGGQVLMTEPVYDSASGWLAERGLRWADHGMYQLKGIKEPTRIYEVCATAGDGPRQPRGNRVRKTGRLVWTAALLFVAMLVPVAWFLRPAQAPLESILNIRVMRDEQVFVELDEALPLRNQDRLQLVGELSRPVYSSLIWVDSEGKTQVVASSGDKRVSQIAFPSGDDEWITLVGPSGTELCLLVTSEEPMTQLGQVVEQVESSGRFPDLEESLAIWIHGEGTKEVGAVEKEDDEERTRGLGQITHESSEKPQYRADKIRQLLHKNEIVYQGVAFTHTDSQR